MEFKRLDKRKGSGAASIRSRYAYLIHLPDIEYFPPTDEKGVRLEGDIVLQEGRTMIPVYLTNPSQEYSYETQGADDEKTFRVKFTGTHPGTELEALEFSKNLLEESFLILIPGCEKNAPGKLLGQIDNPLIFTSAHKAGKEGDKFTFTFEQRIGSEYIYFSYGGVINLPPSPDGPPSDPGHSGFDPSKWARIDASNIDEYIEAWKAKLNVGSANFPPGTDGQIYEIANELPEKIRPTDRLTENEMAAASALTTLSGVLEELADIEQNKANKDASAMSAANIISWQEALKINELQINLQAQIDAEKTARENADIAEANARAFADGILQSKIDLKLDRPTGGTDGDVLIKSGTTSIWSSIVKGIEFAGNAILKLKIITFGGYTIAQKTAIVSPTEGMLIYQNESPKGFQKYENGAWTAVGSNLSNTDLSNVSARTFTQGNIFTWNTAGFFYYLKGLIDKTGNAAYSKVVVVHPTTGEMVTRDFADPAATTLAVQNANASQKTAMRTALLGTSTPPSPIINVVNTYYIKKNTFSMLILSGVNLVPLDPTSIWIQNGAARVDAISYFAISAVGLQTFWNIPNSFPTGEYLVNLSFGAVAQGANIGKLVIVEESTPLNYDTGSANVIFRFRTGYTPIANTFYFTSNNSLRMIMNSTNYPSVADGTLDSAAKTANVFLGNSSSSWEIVIEMTATTFGGNAGVTAPYITLTETTNAQFTDAETIFQNYNIFFVTSANGNQIRNSSGAPGVSAPQGATNPVAVIVIRKAGDVLTTYLLDTTTGAISGFVTTSIDTTKNYALAFLNYRVTNSPRSKDMKITSSIYNA